MSMSPARISPTARKRLLLVTIVSAVVLVAQGLVYTVFLRHDRRLDLAYLAGMAFLVLVVINGTILLLRGRRRGTR